ncbi:MAG: hypothetical protein JHD37_09440 [Ilumatobacteraceae bacterium]|jgi:hypothetical protein|nr:hypothetical protein [Ilumatobacteraceae bacterium]
MLVTQRQLHMTGSTSANIALAVEASALFQEITGASLSAWIATAGVAPGTFGFTTWAADFETISARNGQMMASSKWADLEIKASKLITAWGDDQILQAIVLPPVRGADAQPGAVMTQTIIRGRQDSNPMEMLEWAMRMSEVAGRVTGLSSGLLQFGYGTDWGSYGFTSLGENAAAVDAGTAKSAASEEYMSTFMEGSKYVDRSSSRRLLLTKLA